MKRNSLLPIVVLLLSLFISCNKFELEPEFNGVNTVTASIENFSTRTTIDGNIVNWEQNDKISLLTENGENIPYTLVEGEGTTDGVFRTDVNVDGKEFVAAVYPYNENTFYINGKITTILEGSYNWKEGENSKALMAAQVSDYNISFKNAGALIAIAVNNIPADFNEISLFSETSINGSAEINFTNGTPICSINSDDISNKTTKINFDGSDVLTNKVFYFPIGTRNTSAPITISLSDGTNTIKLLENYTMSEAKRNVRYYRTFNFDAAGNMATIVDNNSINIEIGNGITNFILDSNESEINLTANTNSELMIAVTSTEANFLLEGDGITGKIILSTPAQTKNLTVDVPNASFEIRPDAGIATFDNIIATTSENTLIIPAGVTVNNLTIKGGNVRVYGKILSIINENSDNSKVKIYKENGSELPNNLNSDDFEVISVNTPTVKTKDELLTALNNANPSDVVKLEADIIISDVLWIKKSVILDLNGYTITAEGNRAIRILNENTDNSFINVTIKNGSIYSNVSAGRCIETRSGYINLLLENIILTTSSTVANQPLTVGGSGNNIKVSISNCKIDAGRIGYAITTFNPVLMNVNNSKIFGWNALNIKSASGSLGSKGSIFNVENSTIITDNLAEPNESNSFTAITIEDNDVTLNVSGNTKITSLPTNNYQPIFTFGSIQTNNILSGINIHIKENVSLEGSLLSYRTAQIADNKVVVDDIEIIFPSQFNELLINAGWTTEAYENGYVKVTGKQLSVASESE